MQPLRTLFCIALIALAACPIHARAAEPPTPGLPPVAATFVPPTNLVLAQGNKLAVEEPTVVLSASKPGAVLLVSFCTVANAALSQPEVAVVSIHLPDGSPLTKVMPDKAFTDLKISPSDQITNAGAQVSLRPVPSLFSDPGTYKVVLRVQATDGQGIRQQVFALLTLVQHAAETNADEFKDLVLPVVRHGLWGTASSDADITLPLRETGPTQCLAHVTIKGDSITAPPSADKPTYHRAVSGTVNVSPSTVDRLDASATIPLKISLQDVGEIGFFDTSVTICSPSLAKRNVTIPLHLRVTDAAWIPLAAVALGVGLGALANFLTYWQRPYLLNQYKLLTIGKEIARLQKTAAAPANNLRLQNIDLQRLAAERDNRIGDNAAVQTDLANLTASLNTFRTDRAKASEAVSEGLATARARIESYHQLAGKADLSTLSAPLDNVDALLADDRVDAAGIELKQWTDQTAPAGFASFLQTNANDVQAALGTIKNNPANSAHVADLTNVGALLSQGNFPGAYARLEVFFHNQAPAVGGAVAPRFAAPAVNLDVQIKSVTLKIVAGQVVVFAISLVGAVLTAFVYFDNGKTFGTASDVCLAILWGLGLDTTVRGFANVLQGVRGPNTAPPA